MLLSFAQFEREITGERLRDKIAASKKKWVDAPCAKEIFFRKLQAGEIRTDATVDMVAPEKIESVGRRIGDRFCLLNNSNSVHMAQKNPYSTAMTWTYGTEIEDFLQCLCQQSIGGCVGGAGGTLILHEGADGGLAGD